MGRELFGDGNATALSRSRSANKARSLHDANFDVLRGGILYEQAGHALGPAVQALWSGERDDNGENAFRFRCNHGALGIAGGAAVRTAVVGKKGQAFKIQIILADALVGLARATYKGDRKSTRLNSSHRTISYAVFCLK